MELSIIQKYYQNDISEEQLLTELDNAIDSWHEGSSNLSLHEYLGLCWPEYVLYVKSPSKFIEQMKAQKFGLLSTYAVD